MTRPALALALLALAGCGGGDERLHVWFVGRDETLRPVERDLPERPRSLMHALLAGPTPSERDAGLVTEIPSDAELAGVSLRNGVAHVHLRADMPRYAPNTVTFALRLAQIVYTLTEHPRVRRVRIDVDGQPWGLERHDGSLIAVYTRDEAPLVCDGHIWVARPPRACD
jgi:hypothetical protein